MTALASLACTIAVLRADVARGADPLPTDPFAQPTASAAGQGAASNPFRAAAGGNAGRSTTAATPKSRRAQCDQALLDARRALSVGDIARAQQFLGQAEQLEVAYEGPGDSPQKVAESIQQGAELAELRKSSRGGEAWRAPYAKFLVVQADALATWNDFETATRTANEAAQLNPNFAQTGLTPQSVLKRVAELRKASVANVAGAGTIPVPGPIAAAKAQTLNLLAQARAALAAGDLATAETLAGQASALNVPESQFAPSEDRPSRVAADLLRSRTEISATELAAVGLPATETPEAVDYAQAAAEAGSDLPIMQIAELPAAAPLPLPAAEAAPGGAGDPNALLEAGEQALRAGDTAAAYENFRAAYAQRNQLDVVSQQRLQGHLQMLTPESPDSKNAGESVATPRRILRCSTTPRRGRPLRPGNCRPRSASARPRRSGCASPIPPPR